MDWALETIQYIKRHCIYRWNILVTWMCSKLCPSLLGFCMGKCYLKGKDKWKKRSLQPYLPWIPHWWCSLGLLPQCQGANHTENCLDRNILATTAATIYMFHFMIYMYYVYIFKFIFVKSFYWMPSSCRSSHVGIRFHCIIAVSILIWMPLCDNGNCGAGAANCCLFISVYINDIVMASM